MGINLVHVTTNLRTTGRDDCAAHTPMLFGQRQVESSLRPEAIIVTPMPAGHGAAARYFVAKPRPVVRCPPRDVTYVVTLEKKNLLSEVHWAERSSRFSSETGLVAIHSYPVRSFLLQVHGGEEEAIAFKLTVELC